MRIGRAGPKGARSLACRDGASPVSTGKTCAMRVIAGQYRRRTLRSLPGIEIRATADRLPAPLVTVLCAGAATARADSPWLVLCAGPGAVGFEALSWGARMVCFVDSSKAAAE